MSTEIEIDPQATYTALEALLPKIEGTLYNFLFGLLHNRQTAEDAFQDTLLKALLVLAKGTGRIPPAEPEIIMRWLYRIAKNTAIDHMRHRTLITWIPLSYFVDDRGIGAGLPYQGTQPSYTEEQEEDASYPASLSTGYTGASFEDTVATRELIEQALILLPPEYASCLRLCALDYSCREIAQQFHTTEAAVKTRLFRARRMLADFYAAN